ncbi:hypothetical protein [Actinoallomurus acaciae]|uniref:Transposase n=1 Tax=Actinoallomurus acaciae TaxID=502577 RepID=A0ABV5YE16_9ACTN
MSAEEAKNWDKTSGRRRRLVSELKTAKSRRTLMLTLDEAALLGP